MAQSGHRPAHCSILIVLHLSNMRGHCSKASLKLWVAKKADPQRLDHCLSFLPAGGWGECLAAAAWGDKLKDIAKSRFQSPIFAAEL